ncbi:ArsR/SmtB family transcription factor [Paenibacillus thalictri]|uniref:Transcriptional regulator n=1 Tax=Paenibacillus thalictri TaxID=2527873 RepID=A0A4Q9DXD5_9BACL|nr:helix-turn-helix transcriptional regulator [Paenibacillus thalictri]TBL81035.1 transcriptional regulator [Paenibacillus thalictri]
MDTLSVIKALSNETRYHILEWLKDPDQHFGSINQMPSGCDFAGGVCVGAISAKSGLAQSVISSYLVKMQKAGLLEARRHCQWTYYRRNEQGIAAFKESILKDL